MSYLAKALGFGMLLEAKGWEMNASTEYPGLCQNTDTTNAIQFHFHVRVTVGVAEVGEMRPPCRVLGVPLHDDCVFIECIGQCQCSLGFLP